MSHKNFTLGKRLVSQSILTEAKGKGSEELWRDLSAIPSGSASAFDIHFRVIDDTLTSDVVLTSDCYQYQAR